MPEFTILDVTDLPALEAARQGQMDKLIRYQTDDGRVRYLRVPSAGATETTIVAAIKKDLADLKALVGKKYQHP